MFDHESNSCCPGKLHHLNSLPKNGCGSVKLSCSLVFPAHRLWSSESWTMIAGVFHVSFCKNHLTTITIINDDYQWLLTNQWLLVLIGHCLRLLTIIDHAQWLTSKVDDDHVECCQQWPWPMISYKWDNHQQKWGWFRLWAGVAVGSKPYSSGDSFLFLWVFSYLHTCCFDLFCSMVMVKDDSICDNCFLVRRTKNSYWYPSGRFWSTSAHLGLRASKPSFLPTAPEIERWRSLLDMDPGVVPCPSLASC